MLCGYKAVVKEKEFRTDIQKGTTMKRRLWRTSLSVLESSALDKLSMVPIVTKKSLIAVLGH